MKLLRTLFFASFFISSNLSFASDPDHYERTKQIVHEELEGATWEVKLLILENLRETLLLLEAEHEPKIPNRYLRSKKRDKKRKKK